MHPVRAIDQVALETSVDYVPTTTEEVLWEVAKLLISDSAHMDVFETLASAMERLVHHDLLIIATVDHEKRVARPFFAVGESRDEYLADNELPFGETVIGRAAAQRLPVFVNDLHLDPRNTHVPGTTQWRPQSAIAIPLFDGAKVTAVFFISRLGDAHHFSREEYGIARRFADLAQRRLASETVRQLLTHASLTDPLTGAFNRREFDIRLALTVESPAHGGRETSLILFDIDDFKKINDRFGHDVGDDVLSKVAEAAKAGLRTEDVVCRLGGEEFAVLLSNIDSSLTATLAERIRANIQGIVMEEGPSVTVSVGVAYSPDGTHTAEGLYRVADQSLYLAKRKGKNQVAGPPAVHPAKPPTPLAPKVLSD